MAYQNCLQPVFFILTERINPLKSDHHQIIGYLVRDCIITSVSKLSSLYDSSLNNSIYALFKISLGFAIFSEETPCI